MMSQKPRVLLVGFGSVEFREFVRLGVDVRAWIHARERGDRFVPEASVEIYPHYSVVRCEHSAPLRLDVPAGMMSDLYRDAFAGFRRHFHRIAFSRKNKLKSWVHVDSLFHMSANFFYDLLKRQQIDTIIFSNFPHEGSLIILYQLAKRLGIETILSMQSNFPSRVWIVLDIADFGDFDTIAGAGEAIEAPDAPTTPFYMNRGGKLKRTLVSWGYILIELLKLIAKAVTFVWLIRPHALERNLNRFVHAIEKANGGHPSPADEVMVDLNTDFIYFPLHYQPELTTDTWGYEYGDQLLALEELARRLPEGMKIYVKENPIQTRFMREDSFFRRLRTIPNTYYVSSDVSSFELIRKCACVATIAGTAGWEASLLGKGVIIFGVTWYSKLDGVFKWSDPDCVGKAMAHRGTREDFVRKFSAVTRKLYPGLLDRGFKSIVPEYDHEREAKKAVASLVSVLEDGRGSSIQ
jgi:hypothetical protein